MRKEQRAENKEQRHRRGGIITLLFAHCYLLFVTM
jgi:hypothetical protein